MPTPNPLTNARNSKNPFQDIQDFAHDLAYGSINGYWSPYFHRWRETLQLVGVDSESTQLFETKWEQQPSIDLLLSYGYLTELKSSEAVQITEKALNLVNNPANTKTVFISYRRKDSSALALLIEARLRIAGAIRDTVFIDKDIAGGDKWFQKIEDKIKQCDYFVCLIGKETFNADSFVFQELEMLRQTNPTCAIIPVFHNGTQITAQVPEIIKTFNGFVVRQESALDYEMAVSFVLNAMGYSTY